MDALGLDQAWWLVSPGNPLKPTAGMAPLPARLKSAEKQARRAPIVPTAIERQLGTRYTDASGYKTPVQYIGQPGSIPQVEALAGHCADNADCGHRSPGL